MIPIIVGSSHKVTWRVDAPADRAVFAFKHGVTQHGWHIYRDDGTKIIIGPHSGVSRAISALLDSYPDRIHVAVTIRTPSRSELELECKYQRQGFLKKTMTDSAWRKTIGICRAISRTARELGIESVWTVADLDEMAKMIDQLKHGGPLDFSSAARQFDPEKIE